MGCNQGRRKPQKIEVKATHRSHSRSTKILYLSLCLPDLVTLHSVDTSPSYLTLWKLTETAVFAASKTWSPTLSPDTSEVLKSICTLKIEASDQTIHRMLFAACVHTKSFTAGKTCDSGGKVTSLIKVWDLEFAFELLEELCEFAPGEVLQSLAAGDGYLGAVSCAWLYVWTCRIPGGERLSVYRNPVFSLSFQLSLGLQSPGTFSIQLLDGISYLRHSRKVSLMRLCRSPERRDFPLKTVFPIRTDPQSRRIRVIAPPASGGAAD